MVAGVFDASSRPDSLFRSQAGRLRYAHPRSRDLADHAHDYDWSSMGEAITHMYILGEWSLAGRIS